MGARAGTTLSKRFLLLLVLLLAASAWALLRADSRPASVRAPSLASPAGERLGADEAAGGHTLARHVGLDDRALADRLRREPSISAASTFPDRSTAERVVAAALAGNRDRLERWLQRRGPADLALDFRGRPGQPIGRVLLRGESSTRFAYDARVVVRRRGDSFFVLTAYPLEATR